MPRDSSGNYTLPVGNPVIDGTVIDVNWANPTMNDIAVQLNNVITRDGLLGPTLPMYFVDGTPALPGIAFNAQHGTGIWRDSAQIGVSYAGVTKQTWGAAGTTVAGTVGLSDGSALSWGDGSVKIVGDSATDILTLFTAGTERMRIDAAGNVGIGTSTPGFVGINRVLSVDGVGQAMMQLRVNGVDMAHWFANALQVSFDTPANVFMNFSTNGTERMRIDAAGNVGIGITPAARLHVSGPTGAATNVIHWTDNANNTGKLGIVPAGATVGADGFLAFYTNLSVVTAERMRIDTAGNVSIANTSAVPAAIAGAGVIYIEAGALKYRGSSGTITVIAPA